MKRTPLKRGTKRIRRRTPLRYKSARQKLADEDYAVARKAYLLEHPWCMIWIAMHGLEEKEVIRRGGWCQVNGRLTKAPRASEVHHRNKCRRTRKLDQRWWMASCPGSHDYVEDNKAWARAEGYLLPLEADEDGCCPNGTRCLETPAFMASKVLPRGPVSALLSPER